MAEAAFLGSHYAALLLFALACWGVGRVALRRLLIATPMQSWLAHGLSLCAGIGIMICALQMLAIAGLLKAPWLFALLTVGWIAAIGQVSGRAGPLAAGSAALPGGRFLRLHWTVWLLLLLGLGTVLFPLRPPYVFDELMYHLPHARQWANSGKLQINEWLRYPYFPYNYHLLYAAALVLADDVMPHLLHALAGWITALLLYQLALRQTTRAVACIAAIAWLALVRNEFGNAQIDMALAMFLLAGWIAFMLWWQAPAPRPVGWLVLAAFLLGVAAGIKYQMLGFLPFFAVALLLRERRPKTLLLVLAAGLLPCAYWYLRNALLTGDPFDPLGGRVFGFYDWNQADLDYQLKVLRDVRDWPSGLLWPAAAAPLLPSIWRHAGLRLTLGFGAYAFGVWWLTSHYSRYLLPAYPMLLLLAAQVTVVCAASLASWLRKPLGIPGTPGPLGRGRMQGIVGAVLAIVALQTTWHYLARDWEHVAATPAQRDAYLAWEYRDTLNFLNRLPPDARIYQHGLEGALYYAPQPIYGDHFGRWRYTDFINLTPPQLAARMTEFGLDTLALRIDYSQRLLQDKELLLRCFDLIHQDRMFEIFRVKPGGGCTDRAAAASQQPGHSGSFVIGPSLRAPQ